VINIKRLEIEDAFILSGAFGRYQFAQSFVNTIVNGATMFFFNAFAFLEVVPQIRCMINGVWNESDQEANLEEYCADPESPTCEIDYQAKTTLKNLISQLDFICAPGWKLGLVGSVFLVGIVVGCSFVTKMGDKYGRRPVYGAGLFINGSIVIVLLL
jgi:MFS family permease